ncbi:MAG: hypothetical protein HC877_23260 [Thioploca sp.]|nr:hypothetical protein [Thioploca sp.]
MLYQIHKIAKDLKLYGENEIADKIICAFAAITDAEMPRIDLSYTYIMRELRKENKHKDFQISFKKSF